MVSFLALVILILDDTGLLNLFWEVFVAAVAYSKIAFRVISDSLACYYDGDSTNIANVARVVYVQIFEFVAYGTGLLGAGRNPALNAVELVTNPAF